MDYTGVQAETYRHSSTLTMNPFGGGAPLINILIAVVVLALIIYVMYVLIKKRLEAKQ